MLSKKKHVALVNETTEEKGHAMAIDSNSKFVWTHGANVIATWEKNGFIPPTQYRNDYLFKLNRDTNKPTK